MLSPPKKIRAQDDLQKEAATTVSKQKTMWKSFFVIFSCSNFYFFLFFMQQRKEAQDVRGSIGEQGEGRSHDLQKEPEVVS
jgi:hypothetical protein